jgi:CheY-like chemotaxis protein
MHNSNQQFYSTEGDSPVPPLKVLIVHPSINTRFTLAAALQKVRTCEIWEATNGREAFAMVEGDPFDLIFMAIHMPELDGLTATHRIRQLPCGRAVKIVALTAGQATPITDDDAAMSLGFNGFFEGPTDYDSVRAQLRRHIDVH